MGSPWIIWVVPKANGRRPSEKYTEDTQTQEKEVTWPQRQKLEQCGEGELEDRKEENFP